MPQNIFVDKKDALIESIFRQKEINQNMDDLKVTLPYIIENIKLISFLEKHLRNGKQKD